MLRGWAVVLELEVRESKKGHLKLRRIGPHGERYRKHFLDLSGLGIRELHFHGDDLLILTGPTMDLDGPVMVFRWRRPLDAGPHQLVEASDIERLLTLPHGFGTDHAEGIASVSGDDGSERLLAVYDSPDPRRLHDNGASMDCDLFEVPCVGGQASSA